MPDIIKVGLKLFIITVIAALILGITDLATQGPIEQQRINAANLAKQTVLPQADDFNEVDIVSEAAQNDKARILEISAGMKDNKLVGYTFKVMTNGYGGDIEITVGINMDGKVEGVQIGQHSETPGLGAKIIEKTFTDQYQGKVIENPISVTKNQPGDQEIQAISGATVSSHAVNDGVNLAAQYFLEILKSGGGQ